MNTSWLSSRRAVYTEFLTQLAVAWFAGGIIAPIVAPTATTSAGFTPTILSLAASFLSLRCVLIIYIYLDTRRDTAKK